jgi:hypothetical protein
VLLVVRNLASSASAVVVGAWVALAAVSCGSGGGSGSNLTTDAGADSESHYDAHGGGDTGVGPDSSGGPDSGPGGDAASDGLDAGVTCPPPGSQQGPTCDACIMQNCPAAWCACLADTDNVDDAGISGCIRYVGCVESCVANDGGTPTDCLQTVCATSAYTMNEQHEGQAFLDCSVQYCSTPCGQ